MGNYVKCPVCSAPSTESCKGCERIFCSFHIYRHPDCGEGR